MAILASCKHQDETYSKAQLTQTWGTISRSRVNAESGVLFGTICSPIVELLLAAGLEMNGNTDANLMCGVHPQTIHLSDFHIVMI